VSLVINNILFMTQKQFKLVTRINKILLITYDTTQKQCKLVTRINKILLITNDTTQKQSKFIGNQQYFINTITNLLFLCRVIGNQQYLNNTGH
jgi:CRISPR/Cas system-associated protein Csm6